MDGASLGLGSELGPNGAGARVLVFASSAGLRRLGSVKLQSREILGSDQLLCFALLCLTAIRAPVRSFARSFRQP